VGAAFLVIVALTVSVAMQVVGVLLVFALLVGPPATAARLVHRPGWTVSLAMLLGLLYTWLGILLAANGTWPVSFFIAAISFGVYLPVRLFSRLIRRAEDIPYLQPGSAQSAEMMTAEPAGTKNEPTQSEDAHG
jgi:zinc/manganese transport system permease protein